MCEAVTDPFFLVLIFLIRTPLTFFAKEEESSRESGFKVPSMASVPTGKAGLAGRKDPDVGCPLSADLDPKILPGGRVRIFSDGDATESGHHTAGFFCVSPPFYLLMVHVHGSEEFTVLTNE